MRCDYSLGPGEMARSMTLTLGPAASPRACETWWRPALMAGRIVCPGYPDLPVHRERLVLPLLLSRHLTGNYGW